MPGPETPDVQVGEPVALVLHDAPHPVCHAAVRIHVEQDGTRVPHEAVCPGRDHARAHDARERVHPKPAERTGQQQADDDQHGDGGIRHNVDQGGPHVVVAVSRAVRVVAVSMFLEGDRRGRAADQDVYDELVRFRDLLETLQVAAAVHHGEGLAAAIRPHRLDRNCSGR